MQQLEPRIVLDADPANLIAQFRGDLDSSAEPRSFPFQIGPADAMGLRGTQVLTFRVDPDAGSQLNPAAPVVLDESGVTVPLNATRDDLPDSSSGMIVAELTPGDYTLQVHSEAGSQGAFEVDVLLAGDLNGDGRVLIDDRAAMIMLLRSRTYSVSADVNLDGYLTSFDTGHLLRNYGTSTSIGPLQVSASLQPGPEAELPSGIAGTSVGQQAIVGVTSPNTPIEIDLDSDGEADFQLLSSATGDFSQPIDLLEGFNSITTIARDSFGQQARSVVEISLDTTPPPLTLDLAAASDSPPAGDRETTFSQVTVEGITEPGMEIKLYRDGDLGTEVASTTSDSEGRYQFLGQPVTLGTNLFTAMASDLLGNTTQINLEVVRFSADTDAPAIQLNLANDTGQSDRDTVTSDPATIAVVTDENDIATVRAKIQNAGSADFFDATHLLQSDGTLSFTPEILGQINGQPLGDGEFTLILEAEDALGNRNAASLTVTLDRAGPVLSISTPDDNAVTNSSVTISGVTTDALSGVVTLEAQLDGGAAISIGHNADGHFMFNSALQPGGASDGLRNYSLRATDVAGNLSPLVSVNYIVDTVAPTIELISPSDEIVTADNVTVRGSVADVGTGVERLRYRIDSSPWETVGVDASGAFQFSTSLPLDGTADGEHRIEFVAEDFATNPSATVSRTFTLDTQSPTTSLTLDPGFDTGVVGDNITSLAQVRINGVTEPGSTVTFLGDGRQTAVDSGGQFSFDDVQLAIGDNALEFRSVDPAGNSAISTLSIVRQVALAELVEGSEFHSQLDVPILVGEEASYVEIQYRNLVFDSDSDFINDAFEIALLDAAGNSLVHTVSHSGDAAFNWTEGEAQRLGANTLADTGVIRIDLSHLPAGTEARLIARLVNNDSDTTTAVQIWSVETIEGDLGTPAGVVTASEPLRRLPENLNSLVDVTGSLEPVYRTTSWQPATSELLTEVQFTNAGNFPLDGPVIATIENLTDPTVRPRGFDGVTADGTPYWIILTETDSQLSPGETTEPQLIAFLNPNERQFSYTFVLSAAINGSPDITSDPDTEAIVEKLYRYDVQAVDPDKDELNYQLIVAPLGMQIDALTGEIQWNAQPSDLGNHSVTVRVDDGRGGVDEQSFLLSVIQPPPNRPPQITSHPIVAAAVGETYQYPVTADDADGDTLTFEILEGPENLSIDSVTGTIDWNPDGEQRGMPPVVIRVSDGNGGQAEQAYRINVLQNPDNNAPVFTSEPPTTLNLPGSTTPTSGTVDPTAITTELNPGEVLGSTVTVTLPEEQVEAFADIVFIVDETRNMEFEPGVDTIDSSRQGWIRSTVESLDQQLSDAGIGPNRFALSGFGHYVSGSMPVQVRQAATVRAIPNQAYDVSFSVAVNSADLDGDGDLDVIGSQTEHYVFLNNGDGTFAPEVRYTSASGYFKFGAKIIADMNGDSILDFVTQGSGSSVQIFIGNGDGTFQQAKSFGTSYNQYSDGLAAGDVNSDGALDVVRSDAGSPQFLNVFLNDGSGNLLDPQQISFPNFTSLASPNLVDINGDGDLDLIAYMRFGSGFGSAFAVRSAFGDGNGNFSDPVVTVDEALGDVHLIDLNNDSYPDMVWSDNTGTRVGIALNDRLGGFSQVSSVAVGGSSGRQSLDDQNFRDIDEDGNLDLIVPQGRGISVLFGDGSGGFSDRVEYQTHAGPTYNQPVRNNLIVGDFDGDNHFDVLQSDTYDAEFKVLHGIGGGRFDGPVQQYAAPSILAGETADVDGDGNQDWITINAANSGVGTNTLLNSTPLLSISFGDGQGGIASRSDYPIEAANAVAVGDVDDDGDIDVVIDQNRTDVVVFENVGGGTLQAHSPQSTTASFAIRSLSIDDLNADGFSDLVVGASSGSSAFYGSTTGLFSASAVPIAAATGNDFARQVVADLDGDGFLDIASPTNSTSGFSVLLSSDDGTLEPSATFFSSGTQISRLTGSDIDGDGDVDLIAIDSSRNAVRGSLWRNDGFGSFVLAFQFDTTALEWSTDLRSADLNNDGFGDIVVSAETTDAYSGSPPGSDVAVFFSNGDGTLRDPMLMETHGSRSTAETVNAISLGDFNGDSAYDLITGSRTYESLSIILNDGYGDLGRFGNAQQFGWSLPSLNADGTGTGTNGNFADAYVPLDSTLNYIPRPGATTYYVLVAATDRNQAPGSPSFAEIRDELQNRGVVFDVIVDAEFQDGSSRTALAVDALGQAIVNDTAGSYEVASGGQFVSGVGQPDYTDLSWSLGGTAWDLDLLRSDDGGVARQAFIDRFIQQIQDKQGSPLTVVASNPDAGFGNVTGTLTGIGPGQSASFDIQLTGGIDGSAFDLLFVQEETNTIVGSIPVTINTLYQYDASAIDPDGDTLSYRFLEAPEDAELDSMTGAVTWRPTLAGEYPFRIEVRDPLGATDVQSFVVSVSSGRANTAPVIDPPGATSATVGQDYSLQLTATDGEDDRLSYFVIEGPDNLSIDQDSGLISWVAEDNQVGLQPVTIQARDGRGGVSETSFNIAVLGAPFNRSPRIQSDPPISAPVGQPLKYFAMANDADGHPIHWDLSVAPEDAAIDPQTGVFVWTPKEYQSRPIDVVIRASDDYGGVDLQRFQITLDRPNSAPLILATPDAQPVVDLPHEYQVLAQDGEDDSLTYSLDASGTTAMIDDQTGLITWTPSIGDVGTNVFAVTVIDVQGNSASRDLVFDVVEDAANAPPQLTGVPAVINPRISFDYSLQLSAVDPNGDPLTFQLLNGPDGMTVSSSGLLHWKPNVDQTETSTVTVAVSDGRGGTSQVDFSAEPMPIEFNTIPQALNDPPSSAVAGRVYAHDFVGFDANGDTIVWKLDAGPVGMSLDQQRGTLRWTPQADQIGRHTVRILVLDNQFLGFDVVTFTVDVRAANSPPLILSTPPTLAAANVPLTYQVDADDLDGDSLVYALDTTLGNIDPNTGRFTWTPGDNNVGTNRITVAVSDGIETTFQTFDIVVEPDPRNRFPAFESTPSFLATLDQTYRYDALAIDPDGGGVAYELIMSPAGMSIDPNTGVLQWIPKALGPVSVVVQATDDAGDTATQSFGIEVRETNNPPLITSTPVEAVAAGGTYRYDVLATDDDPEPLTFHLTGQPDGMAIDPASGQIRWMPTDDDTGVHSFVVSVSDPRGATATQPVNLSVGADLQAPQISISVNPDPVSIGDVVSITVAAVDDVDVTSLRLTVGGQIVPLDSNGTAQILAATAGAVNVTATVRDPSGNVGEETLVLSIGDPSDSDAPIVSIASPQNGEIITGFVDVIGTVADPSLVSYELAVAPFAGGPFTTIATGDTAVTDGLLGRFDPSLLINDTYVLRLTATDAGGLSSSDEILVDVSSELKIGNFALSFTDLAVPVSGIPITVSRTYDSLTAAHESELGYGWRMEIKDADLRTTVPKTGAEDSLIYAPYFDGARVFITVPGGSRVGFTFKVTPDTSLAGRTLGLINAEFVPDEGIESRLEIDDYLLRVNELGEVFDYQSGLPYNPASPVFDGQFTLVTKEGLTYNIDGETGDLISVQDRNDNELTFTDAGVFSSTGVSVAFERDAQGRVTAVIDPNGDRVQYAYDANGDLVSVTDREGIVTRMVYDEPSRPHYLTEVIDPLGRTGIRSQYDADGRLIKMIDANGEAVSLIHDPDNFVETIENQLGFATTYQYDNRGNVVTEIDAEGGVTRYVYDDPNDPTLETSMTKVLADGTELTTLMGYDAEGNLVAETDPLGRTTYSSFDAFGNVLTTTDPLGNTTVNAYDDRGNLLSIVDPVGQATTFTYDAAGNPTTLSLPGDLTQSFSYDGRGNVLTQTDALGHVTSFTYDAAGNQLTETRTQTTPSGVRTLLTEYDYDGEGRAIAERFFEDGVLVRATATEYDAVGNRVAETDPLGRVTRFVYDDRGQMVATIYPDATPDDLTDNPSTATEYDAAGQTLAEIDELGRRTEYRYDKTGRQTEVILPDETPGDLSDNPRRTTVYDRAGRTIAQIDARGNATQFVLDAAGQQTEVVLADETPADLSDNPRIKTEYDLAGRSIRQIDPLGHITEFQYDSAGRPLATIADDGSRTEISFDEAGRLAVRTDQAGKETRYEYDDLGRLIAVIQPEVFDPVVGQRVHPWTEYEYDELGNLVVQRDARGRETLYDYDGQGRRTATILPLGERSTSSYDTAGNLISTTDFNGDTIVRQYDARNRLTLKDLPGDFPDVSYTYTATGQIDTVTDGRGLTDYEYDAQDRLLSRTDPDGSMIAYTYDLAGNRTSVTTTVIGNDPRETTYTFDAQNRQKVVTDPEGDATEYFFDSSGRLVRTELPNNTFEIREYDSLNRLTLIESRHEVTDEVLTSFAYELDEIGNRIAVDEHDGRRVEYDYDELDRLINETIYDPGEATPSRTFDYIYDIVGNRLERDDSDEGVTSYTYDDNDQLLTELLAGDETRYDYDANGNTIAKHTATESVFYKWDPENRLIAADTDGDGADDVIYQYDHTGIRVTRTEAGEETKFLFDKNRPYAQVLEEYTAGGILKVSYVHGRDLLSQYRHSDAGKSFYHVDGLGSTRTLSDPLGIVADRYIYDAYGRIMSRIGSTENDHLFAGEVRDSRLEFDYLRSRFYQPVGARFTSRDFFLGVPSFPSSLHRYNYASGNPVNVIDPSGRFSLVEINVSLTINANLIDVQKSFSQASLVAVATSLAIRETVINPAYTVQQLALRMIANGLPGGEGLYQASRLMIAQGYSAIGVTLQKIYEDTADSLVEFDVDFGVTTAFDLAMELAAIESLVNDLVHIVEKIAKFVSDLSTLTDQGFSDQARLNSLIQLGTAIINRL
ncbi:putative Ig domain-containing protein [Rhodopirellula sp. JC639]|uniref:putative Ig domain-containing protein n=1 Tax=Stieleria mannarensis TaxID=2755585 RepID=UPI001603B161|nr:putative Ig domain-containing protein [Rhodopirellula sp. JC639]